MVGPDDRGWMVKLACDRGDGDGVERGRGEGGESHGVGKRMQERRVERGELGEGEKGCGGVVKLGTQRRGVCS